MSRSSLRILLILTLALTVGCLPDSSSSTAYPTITPLTGFQILGANTPAPATATSTNTPFPAPTQAPATATPEPTHTPLPSPEPPQQTTLVFTGQIVPARCVQAETDRLGQADYIYAEVRDILADAGLTIGTLNAALTDYPPTTGCVETFVLVGRPVQADALAYAGFDVMSVATNHIKNCGLTSCGDIAFFDTLENLERVGIRPVGAGEDLAEASRPVVLEVNGVRFGFVSLGQIEPLAFAGEATPGIAVLTEESLQAAIAAAHEVSDVVIALPHWGPEYTSYPNASQVSLARAAVEAGADLVVGNHTHYIQAYVEIDGVPVYFGLGNFVFDQTQEPARQQSLILRVTFEGTEIIAMELIPAVNEQTGRVRIAGPDEAVTIMTAIQLINAQVQADLE